MKIQSAIIAQFINGLPPNCRGPIDSILCKMLESSKYIDDSTLIYDETGNWDKEHYHNWDCNPTTISELEMYERKEYNEVNDITLTTLLNDSTTPNIECIKGDIQLGKRVHACILMWISIYVYERPVIYLFRPLNIDKEQFQDDIDGTQSWNFNIEWVKSEFDKKMTNGYSNKKYFDYRLPSLTDVKNKKIANKLSDKEFISNPNMIYMALMNPTDLETLNKKFYDYILDYCEKVNITLIIDESDLLSPTAKNSNDVSDKDTKNSKSEKLISRLVNKVAHTIHITGTAHSFFWNFTTALSEEDKTFIPVEKVFVMNRHENYYGFMKNNILFSPNVMSLPVINEWWSKGKGVRREDQYEIIKDYNINIKKIISSITKRKNKYNSFLISEEKVQNNQIKLAEKIITDFNSVFCLVFHGKQGKNGLPTGLRLYFPSFIEGHDIESILRKSVVSEKRLNKSGGIYHDNTASFMRNNYKYFDINMQTKEFTIKMVYKVLAMVFKSIESNKTTITITGKYGERGYSFTSDYYDNDNKYVLHITDQYFVSHASYNCTDIFQRARIQGKYTDNLNLTFWTTTTLMCVIKDYVNFLTKIENKIMSLPRGHAYIRNLCELNLQHKQFVKTLGTQKQRKNLESECIKYDKKNNAMIYDFPHDLQHVHYEEHFSNWCIEQGIEFDGFINALSICNKQLYIKKKGRYQVSIPLRIKYEELNQYILSGNRSQLDSFIKSKFPELKDKVFYKQANIKQGSSNDRWSMLDNAYQNKQQVRYLGFPKENIYRLVYNPEIEYSYIIYSDKTKILPQTDTDILNKNNFIETNNNQILYSELKNKFINDNFLQYEYEFYDDNQDELYDVNEDELNDDYISDLDKDDLKIINDHSYFFITADGYAYHHDPDKSINKIKLKIKTPQDSNNQKSELNIIQKYFEQCVSQTHTNNRLLIKALHEHYKKWCQKNNINNKLTKMKDFRQKFECVSGLQRSKSNGTDGYKIKLAL